MGKRIRYPKKKVEQKEIVENKDENKEKQKSNFVLDVHNSVIGGNSKFGN